MKLAAFSTTVLLTLTLVACNGSDRPATGASDVPAPAEAPASGTVAPADAPATPTTDARPKAATAEDIARIEASGRTGLWAEPAALCAGNKRQVATLEWNVKASGAEKVAINLVSKDGKERSFGRGGPVGRKSTGEWARPGLEFVLRSLEGDAELGRATVAEKQC